MRPRLLNGPDDAVRLWWRLVAREESAGGRDPFLIKGSVPADRCDGCGHDRHQEVPAKRGRGWVDRCMRCGGVWESGIEYVVRGTIQVTRRPHGIERRLVDLGDLEHCVDQIPQRDARLYGLYLFTDRSYEFVAELANEYALEEPARWQSPAGGFTLGLVRGAVKRSRRVLRRALERRALLACQVPVLMRSGEREVVEALEPLPIEAVVPGDPARWSGLLQDIELGAAARLESRLVPHLSLTRLSRGSTAELGTVYREVPV